MPATTSIWKRVAIAIPAATLGAEALPLILGTGERAVWDWGFLYVTLHFVALPTLALGVLATFAYRLAITRGRVDVPAACAALASVAYLAALYFWSEPWVG